MKVQKINLSMTKAGSYANRRNRDRYEGNKTIVKEQITPMDQSLKYQMKIVIGMKMKV
jgi:hypothetical protein